MRAGRQHSLQEPRAGALLLHVGSACLPAAGAFSILLPPGTLIPAGKQSGLSLLSCLHLAER